MDELCFSNLCPSSYSLSLELTPIQATVLWFTHQIVIYQLHTYLSSKIRLDKIQPIFLEEFYIQLQHCFISSMQRPCLFHQQDLSIDIHCHLIFPSVIPFFKLVSRISFLNTRSQTNAQNVTNTLDRFEILPRPSFRTSL